MSKVKSVPQRDDLSGKRWASTLSISDNVSRQGIELYFDSVPHPELQSKLRVLGFLPGKSQAMWYAKASGNTRKFAEDVKASLAKVASGPDLFIQPSYEVGKANIENKRFSFVLISLKDGQEKSFIVFEPSKPRAEVIAANYAYKHFGDKYLAIAVNPRTKMREARILYDEGKIIHEDDYLDENRSTRHSTALQNEAHQTVSEEQKPARLEMSVGSEQGNLTMILNQFHTWLKDHPDYKGSTKIERKVFQQWLLSHHGELNLMEAEELWNRHERLVKVVQKLGRLDTTQIKVGSPKEAPTSEVEATHKEDPNLETQPEKQSAETDEHASEHTSEHASEEEGSIKEQHKQAINEYSHLAYDLLKKFIPGLEELLKQKNQGKLQFDSEGENRKINFFIRSGYSQLFITEHIDGEPQLESDIRIDVQSQQAYVTSEWLSDYYVENYQRTGEGIEGDDMAIGNDMTRALSEWLEELTEEGHELRVDGAARDNQEEPDIFKSAYSALKRLIPDIDQYLKGKQKKTKIEYQLGEETKELSCEFDPAKSSVLLLEAIKGKRQMKSTLSVDLKAKEARVTTEWLSDYYSEGLGRFDVEAGITNSESLTEADRTRAFVQWIDDLNGLNLKITSGPKKIKFEDPLAFLNEPLTDVGQTGKLKFNPVWLTKLVSENPDLIEEWQAAYKEDPKVAKSKFTREEVRRLKDFYNTFILGLAEKEESYRLVSDTISDDYFEILDKAPDNQAEVHFQRSYKPSEEKQILDRFTELGFSTPFSVKEAFERRFSVTDVGLRYQSTEQYYKREIAAPLKKREKALLAEQKQHQYKTGTKKEAAIRSELWEIGVRLLRGEECYKKENEIFKDDFFEAVLKLVDRKGFSFANQSDLESFVNFIDSAVFDENVFEDYHRDRIDELTERLIGEYFHEQAKQIKTQKPKEGLLKTIDIIRQGNAVPYVLVPAGTQEPFWSNRFSMYDMEEVIKTNFPDLRKLTSSTLFKATATQMYELVQMSHPNDYGLKVNRDAVLREWEKRGKELFTSLGFPTDADYPYVNIHTGYRHVEPLGHQLHEYSTDGNHWWAVAEHNRPVADLPKALGFIHEQINKLKKGIRDCVNPKTNKPTAAKKEEYRDLNFDLEYFQSGKQVIENYLKKSGLDTNKSSPSQKNKAPVDLSVFSAAYWASQDNKYPVNKALIHGQEFNFSKLRHEFKDLLGRLPVPEQYKIVGQVAKQFPVSTSLQGYAKGLVTIGISGMKREKVVLAGYLDKIIVQHDLSTKTDRDYKVSQLIIDLLLNRDGDSEDTSAYGPDGEPGEEELITVPFPKTTQIEAKVTLVRSSDGTFVMGTQYNKRFGSQTYQKTNPGDNTKKYPDRTSAIIDGLLELQDRLRYEMQHKDSIYNSESKKNMKVKKALDALEAFAKEFTSAKKDSQPVTSSRLVPELQDALWQPADEEYPVNLALIDGVKYQQDRLRKAFIGQVRKLPMQQRMVLAEDISERFNARPPFQEYMADSIKRGGRQDYLSLFFDKLIVDADIWGKSGWKVCSYLISALFKKDDLVDAPLKEKPPLRKIAKTDQHKLNLEIEALIDEKDSNGESFSEQEKELIRQYAGSGGLLKQGAKGRGVLYEYYTPDWLVEQMWGLAHRFGYDGGSVLEPSVGTGNFLKYAPKQAVISGFETNRYSARIARALYPHAQIEEKSFESLFFSGNIHLKDQIKHPLYSLVIGNPPYGEFTGKYAGMGEKKWTGALEYDQYFMLRGLDLLEPGGLMVFLIPSQFIQNGNKYNKTKEKIFQKAEVLMCYRLPQSLFNTTDIGTDIIVLKKRSTAQSLEKNAQNVLNQGIDTENLPTLEAKKAMRCDITGLAIHSGDRIFYDKEKNLHIKYLKIKGGDNPQEILRLNPWLPKIIKELFANYMEKHGGRNELREKYYSSDAIYDPELVVDAALEYIHEAMYDAKVKGCWIHKIDIIEAFGD